MEKYYLTKLFDRIDRDKSMVNLVEVQFARRPPTFGVIYLDKTSSKQSKKPTQTLVLSILELSDNNVARIIDSQRILIGDELSGCKIVSFDSSRVVFFDDNASNHRSKQVSCIAIAEDGSLFAICLSDGSNKCLSSSRELRYGRYLKCCFNQSLNATGDGNIDEVSRDNDHTTVHILAEKCYFSYDLSTIADSSSQPSLDLLQRYKVSEASFHPGVTENDKFVNLEVAEPLIILELNDRSLRFINQSTCVGTISLTSLLGPYQDHVLLVGQSSSATDCEAVLISRGGTRIISHSLQVHAHNQQASSDPDQLLPQQPSFELDQCWSIDLADLDSIRPLREEDEDDAQDLSHGCLFPVWSFSSAGQSSWWPKYLLVTYKYHILIYSFEQQQVHPFSTVYDKSFLSIISQEGASQPTKTNKPQQSQVYIDIRMRPELVHNFRLIGPQPADSLFNTLFLASKVHLTQAQHFNSMGLIIAVSGAGHLLALKVTSNLLVQHKDSHYQQLVADSLRGSFALLQEEIDRLQATNRQLIDDIEQLKSITSSTGPNERSLDELIEVELKQHNNIGSLYDLNITISNLIQVSRIIVVPTVNSYLLKPRGQSIKMENIDNHGELSTAGLQFLFASANDVSDDKALSLQDHGYTHQDLSYAILELDCEYQARSSQIINLPLYIMDGQCGLIKVYCVLNETDHNHFRSLHSLSVAKLVENVSTPCFDRFLLKTLLVKWLMSYQSHSYQSEPAGRKTESCWLKFNGLFDQMTMAHWLNECIYMNDKSSLEGQLTSAFTHCSLHYDLSQVGELELISDDLIALELVKKHIMKLATDAAIKLEVNQSTPNLSQLRRLLSLQFANLEPADRFSAEKNNSQNEVGSECADKRELLFEGLVREMNSLDEIPAKIQASAESIEESIKQDIVRFCVNSEPGNECKFRSHKGDQVSSLLKELVCGFIIDALVDYDKMQSLKISGNVMVAMRSKLDDMLGGRLANRFQFVDRLLGEWESCKKQLEA